jgi:CHAD domain-containing protein
MHRKGLTHIIEKRFAALFQNWNGVREAVKAAVHDWRVDYKKLRAIVRLAQSQEKKLEIPLSLKDVYNITGEIRDRQMQFERMGGWFGTEQFFPPVYSQFLNEEISASVDQLHPLTDNDAILHISQHKIKSSLPAHISGKNIQSYIQNQLYEVRNILWLSYKKDDYLHECRKHLKDVQYLIDAIGMDHIKGDKFRGLPSQEQLQAAAQELGNFNDQCVTMTFLSSSYLNRLPGEEKIILASFKTKLQKEKTKAKNNVINMLEIIMKEIL